MTGSRAEVCRSATSASGSVVAYVINQWNRQLFIAVSSLHHETTATDHGDRSNFKMKKQKKSFHTSASHGIRERPT